MSKCKTIVTRLFRLSLDEKTVAFCVFFSLIILIKYIIYLTEYESMLVVLLFYDYVSLMHGLFSVANSSGFSRKIPDFQLFSGFLPGSGIFRIFCFLLNYIWFILNVKICTEAYEHFLSKPELLKLIHSSPKYSFKRQCINW